MWRGDALQNGIGNYKPKIPNLFEQNISDGKVITFPLFRSKSLRVRKILRHPKIKRAENSI